MGAAGENLSEATFYLENTGKAGACYWKEEIDTIGTFCRLVLPGHRPELHLLKTWGNSRDTIHN